MKAVVVESRNNHSQVHGVGELPSGCWQDSSATGVLEAAQGLSVAVMDMDGASAVLGVSHCWVLLWFQPGGGHKWLNCFQSHAQRWQSISLDLPSRDPLAEGCSQCSSVTGRVESPESPGLAAHHLPGGFRPGQRRLWLLFVVVGSLIPACSASPAAEDCSSSPCLMPQCVSSIAPTPGGPGCKSRM